MNRLKHLENRVRGWLPKEPDLSSYQKISHPSIPQQQPFRFEWQAEDLLLYTITGETGTNPRSSYYDTLKLSPLLALLFVCFWFLLPYSLGGGLSVIEVWPVLLYLPLFYQIILQARLKLKLDQELKKGLVNGAVCLLKYYDQIYTMRRNSLLFMSALSFGLFGYGLVTFPPGHSMLNFDKYFLFVILGLGVVFAFAPFWLRRTRDSTKARVQNMLNQIKPPYEV